jgi:hypothetical protein
MICRYFSGGVFGVPRNMRCSKKCANPDLPGSTSLREPVWTGIWIVTMLGNPVGTTMTFRPLARVVSLALKGRISCPPVVRAAGDCTNRVAVRRHAMRAVLPGNRIMLSMIWPLPEPECG